MKTINSIFLGLLALLFITGCSNDDSGQTPVLGENEVFVNFDLDASDITMEATSVTRTYTPTYGKAGFIIRAFRKDLTSNKFIYYKNIDLTNFTFANNKLTGKQILLVGSYKFLITYGESTSQVTMPTLTLGTTELSEAAAITCSYNAQGMETELFLQTRHQKAVSPTDAGKLKEYNFKVGGETANEAVSEKLQRAVARIDVLFVSATKSGSVYTERAFSAPGNTTKDILDNRAMKLTFDIDKLSNKMSLIGIPSEATLVNNPADIVLNYKNTSGYTNNNKVTIGTGTATTVGKTSYLTYDNVLPAHIITKGAHIFGTYYFPFITGTDATRTTTDLKLTIEGSKSATDVVSRTVVVPKVPLEQNKVTLIIIYVLGDPGTSVFDTNVNFAVEIVTDWLPSHNVIVDVD